MSNLQQVTNEELKREVNQYKRMVAALMKENDLLKRQLNPQDYEQELTTTENEPTQAKETASPDTGADNSQYSGVSEQ